MDKKVLELLNNAPWGHIISELLEYARNKIYLTPFYSINLLKGENLNNVAEDIVAGSINKVLDGTRLWHPNEKNDLIIYLKSVIKSEINHFYNNKKFKATERLPTKQVTDSDDPVETDTMQSDQLTPEEILEDEEKIKQDEIIRGNILKNVEEDSELEEVVLCIMDGIIKPNEIATKLRIKVEAVYNRKKRLKRIFKDLYDQVKKGGIR